MERSFIERFMRKKLEDADSALIKKHAFEFNEALDTVKVCDPAIGSGAFPMGLLQEIYAAKQNLWFYEHGTLEHFPGAEIKQNIIQNSIYGVDIEKGAVDIARLRFWLSLVVDEEEPKALPNLDYKIVVGNSLLSKLNDEVIEIDWNISEAAHGLFGAKFVENQRKLLTKISQEQQSFFNPNSNKEEHAMHIHSLKIDLLVNQLELMIENKGIHKMPAVKSNKINEQQDIYYQTIAWKDSIKELGKLKEQSDGSLNFFDWKLDFPEVLNELVNASPGFDILIGNPPYGAKYNSIDKSFFKRNYITAQSITGIQKGSLDTYTLFIELGHKLTRLNGNLTYIVPISITSSDSVTGVHKLIEETCSKIKISSYAVRPEPVFENATVNTSIISFRKDLKPVTSIMLTKMYRKKGELNLKYLIDNLEFIDVQEVKLIGRYPKISLEIEKDILNKILKQEYKIYNCIDESGEPIYYRTTGGRYFKVITNYSTGSTKENKLFIERKLVDVIGAILSSNLFFWFYQIYSNNLDLKQYEILSFGLPLDKLNKDFTKKLTNIYESYLEDIERNAKIRVTSKYSNIETFKEYKISRSKPIIDQIDDMISTIYGLTKDELLFIKNYEIRFRCQEDDE
jgi:hypothetical protein